MATEFLAYYEMASSFSKLVGSGDIMTGTTLMHHGHLLARILDEKHVEVTTAKVLPQQTESLRGIVTHVLKRAGVIVLLRDLSHGPATRSY